MSRPGDAIAAPRAHAPLRLSAFATSLVGHSLLAAAALVAYRSAPSAPEPLVRLVFMDAAPPPAAVVKTTEPIRTQRQPVQKKVVRRPLAKPVAPEPVTVAEPPPPQEQAATPPVSGGAEGGVAGGIPGGSGTAPVPAGQVARPPVLVRRVVPIYPPAARRRGIGGMVRLEAVLDIRGNVEEPIRVLQSIPDLDEAATEALRQWRFAPARNRSGEPVRVVLEVPIRFVLH